MSWFFGVDLIYLVQLTKAFSQVANTRVLSFEQNRVSIEYYWSILIISYYKKIKFETSCSKYKYNSAKFIDFEVWILHHYCLSLPLSGSVNIGHQSLETNKTLISCIWYVSISFNKYSIFSCYKIIQYNAL